MKRYERQMRRALELAERGWGRVSPNPLVGALVMSGDQVVGEGWHEGPGTPHAEIVALGQAGDRARGSTLVCTLEPCNRFGRTPPCTRSIIRAGVSRIVVGAIDPNLGGDAPGLNELEAAGIVVEVGVLERESRRLNAAFERHVRSGLPYVILKMAASLDGKTAASDGSSKWITGPEARADVQRIRAWADAIVVGAGTVVTDDPLLTVRDETFSGARRPIRVVVDASGRVPPQARALAGPIPTLIATTERAPRDRIEAWAARGAEVLSLDPEPTGDVPLGALFRHLGKRDVQGVLIEGGQSIAWSAVRDGLVDHICIYVAPLLVGGSGAPGILGGSGFSPIDQALRVDSLSVVTIGRDLKLEADVQRNR